MQIQDINFNDPAFLADPYPAFERLRHENPSGYHPIMDTWLFTRYTDIQALLRDKRFGRAHPDERQQSFPPAFQHMHNNTFMEMNPPDHTRLRGLVSKVFTPARVESLRQPIQQLTDKLLDQWPEHGSVDLLATVASPLPVAVIAELLAIPETDRDKLQPWSHAIVGMYEVSPTDQVKLQAEGAVVEFSAYLRQHISSLQKRSGNSDLLTELAKRQADGRSLTEDELVATGILLLNAGHEATVNAAGNGLNALLEHPNAWSALLNSPETIKSAVEEMLRFDPPLQFFRRYALEDVHFAGHFIHRGESVGLLFGSANRDESIFPAPNHFDISRRDNPHITFGAGIHFCLGAPLARLELQILLGALRKRYSKLHKTGVQTYKATFVLRGLESLVVDY